MANQPNLALVPPVGDEVLRKRVERLLDLVSRIYDAALKDEIWPQILASMAPMFDTDKGTLLSLDPHRPEAALTYAVGFDSILRPEFRRRNIELDYWCERSKALPGGTVFLGSELLPVEEMRSSAMYREFGKPYGVEYMIGGIVANRPNYLSIVAFYRADRDFEPRAKALMRMLLPHLQMAVFVNRRLRESSEDKQAAFLALDRQNTHGIVMLNAEGDVLFANGRAIGYGKRDDGISLRERRVVFRSPIAQGEFDRLVQAASQTSLEANIEGGGVFLVPRRGKAAMEVVVSPVTQRSAAATLPATTACIVFIHDPTDRYEVSGSWLQKVYGLTAAEARLCEALFQRESLADAAKHLHIAENTARSQLKGVFVKLGVASQSQLLLRLATSLTARVPQPKKSPSTRRR
jgi:DNA-binding CsgD family transcriptional regulator/PAS domain-containing protein